jgi:hypothetical protein
MIMLSVGSTGIRVLSWLAEMAVTVQPSFAGN